MWLTNRFAFLAFFFNYQFLLHFFGLLGVVLFKFSIDLFVT
jgi:hypothetical protein